MAKSAKSENVPKGMQEKFDQITAITDEFAKEHLNDEYALLIRQATAALCRKRPSPLASSKAKTWACGVAHAIGIVNFLFDSTRKPYISAKDLYAWFGVSSSTGQAKSKLVRDLLKTSQMDPNWTLPSRIDDNPMAWLVSINGMILDARSAPPEVQRKLAEAGMIPHGPEDVSGESQETSSEKSPKKTSKHSAAKAPPTDAIDRSPDALYVLDVSIIDGPIEDDFIEENPQVTRTIEIKGSQTLKALHQIIFKAFDREEEHMYEFQVGGKGPNDPDARRYELAISGEPSTENVAKTSMNDLDLSVGEMFGYWFDLGDDWWHAIEVVDMKEKAGKGNYPKITNRIGASPPQYPDFE